MNGFDRLKSMEKEENNPFISAVVAYLMTREDMEDKYLNEKKTLSGMNEFIENKALELCINNKKKLGDSSTKYASVGLEDKRVYLWAVMYFLLPDEKLGMEKLKQSASKTVIGTVPNSIKKENNTTTSKKIEAQKTKNELVKEQISLF